MGEELLFSTPQEAVLEVGSTGSWSLGLSPTEQGA